jgi:hypothetical protein
MVKLYQRQILNLQSSLFHHGLIQILMVSHFSKVGDNWENFMYRNSFTLPESVTHLPLHFDETPNPYLSNPTMENLCVNLQEIPVSINQNLVVIQNPSKGKKP